MCYSKVFVILKVSQSDETTGCEPCASTNSVVESYSGTFGADCSDSDSDEPPLPKRMVKLIITIIHTPPT